MSEYMFGLHYGHYPKRADKIARKYGAVHVNYTEPNGQKRGWFAGPNRGTPFDQRMADAVFADLDRAKIL